MVITSPNQVYVPEYPRQCNVIRTFSDRLWGVHEYSRWPQELVPNMWHIACIPRRRGLSDLPDILWRNLRPEEDWQEDCRGGVHSLGYLTMPIVEGLAFAADTAISGFHAISGLSQSRRALGQQLCLLLRQCVERMRRLPARPAVAVAVAAHVQRLTLELAGLKLYLEVVAARIDSPQDYSNALLPVLGAFVKEATLAQTCTRVGLPVWFTQELTPRTRIWKVVKPTEVHDLSYQESQPPILHHPDDRPGIVNLTGNWMSTMAQAVSHQLCSPALPSMLFSYPEGLPDAKKPCVDQKLPVSKTLSLPPHRDTPPAPGGLRPTPSLQFCPSPFFSLSECWTRALRLTGVLPQPARASLYFFPPPFLLETVSEQTTPPIPCMDPTGGRPDQKVTRYLHNMVRIRLFCRLRLLDPTISAHPLNIWEWRAALWGKYNFKAPSPEVAGASGRPKRKREQRNEISRLFGNVAALPEYQQTDEPELGGQPITYEMAVTDLRVRYNLLWEAHEVNWRCELMALDEAVVPRAGWPYMYRWEREADVSAVWGESGGVMSVLPLHRKDIKCYVWPSSMDPRWRSALPTLRAFLRLMSRWPDYPQSLRDLPSELDDWMDDDYDAGQQGGTIFYTQTFIKHFRRLPTIPVEFPLEYRI
ncbi:hypothetical protein C8Q79DRAFT_911688 [Trametes meyenii]|nr:hypothetical protein C8Q79DRAFT_911688 [Trametes meyenii]